MQTVRNLLLGICLLGLPVSMWAAPKEAPVVLTTSDGWNLAAMYMPATNKETTVVLLHDLGKNKEAFSSVEKALAKEGFGYLALDLRGHGQSTNLGEYKTFAREGTDNPFNKMTQDVQAALAYLKSRQIFPEQVVLIGAGLGANVAAKAAGLVPELAGIALISPGVNIRDVLPISALRVYKGNVLLAASAGERKGFLEASILRNVSFLTTGEGKVTFLTAYDLASHEMLDKYLISSLLQWVATPQLPTVSPDIAPALDPAEQTTGVWVAPSATEEALVPSVLAE